MRKETPGVRTRQGEDYWGLGKVGEGSQRRGNPVLEVFSSPCCLGRVSGVVGRVPTSVVVGVDR